MTSPRDRRGRGRPVSVIVLALGMAVWVRGPVLAAAVGRPLAVGAIGAPATSTVATGAPRRFGEAVAVATGSGAVVAASSFVSGSAVTAWTQPNGVSGWDAGHVLIPAGFVASYDASIAAGSQGEALVVAGASGAGRPGCLTGGSVFLVAINPASGAEGAPVLVDDERRLSGFDDRPAVAAGPGGAVWAAWSHGPVADGCQVVGQHDVIQVTTSSDGGASFAPAMTLGRATKNPAFGASIVPLNATQAFVVWTEATPGGMLSVVGQRITASGTPGAPQVIATGSALPLTLPGASFYAFTVCRATVLPDGRIVVAWPAMQAGRAVIVVAASDSSEQVWTTAVVSPPAGQDLLLPAVAPAGPDQALLTYAAHFRSRDALGYQWAPLDLSHPGAPRVGESQTLILPAQGPGFYEIGEVLSLVPSASGAAVDGAVVSGSSSESRVVLATWALPEPASPAVSPSPAALASPGRAPPASTSSTRGSRPPWVILGLAALGILAAAMAGRRDAVRRRGRRGGSTRGAGPGSGPDRSPAGGRVVVRRMGTADVEGAIDLHQVGLKNEFITRLGRRLLHRYYRAWVSSPTGLCLLAEVPGEPAVAGLLLGSVNPAAHYRFILRHHGPGLAAAVLGQSIRHPSLGLDLIRTRGLRYARGAIRALWGTVRRPQPTPPADHTVVSPRVGEITHVAVAASRRRTGIGRSLLRAAEDAMREAGVDRIDLVTPLDDEGAARFYETTGWVKVGEIQTSGAEEFARYAKTLAHPVGRARPQAPGPAPG